MKPALEIESNRLDFFRLGVIASFLILVLCLAHWGGSKLYTELTASDAGKDVEFVTPAYSAIP